MSRCRQRADFRNEFFLQQSGWVEQSMLNPTYSYLYGGDEVGKGRYQDRDQVTQHAASIQVCSFFPKYAT
jgi:hypothetical protein